MDERLGGTSSHTFVFEVHYFVVQDSRKPDGTDVEDPGPQCVGDRILHTICCSRTMDLGLHIAVHARKKSFLRHTLRLSTKPSRRLNPRDGEWVCCRRFVRQKFGNLCVRRDRYLGEIVKYQSRLTHKLDRHVDLRQIRMAPVMI
jgi:hypothetical protein